MTFTPAIRLARKITDQLSLGAEYYSDLGHVGHFASFQSQQHTLFGVIDLALGGGYDLNLGVGWGFTKASERLVVKTIFGKSFERVSPLTNTLLASDRHSSTFGGGTCRTLI